MRDNPIESFILVVIICMIGLGLTASMPNFRSNTSIHDAVPEVPAGFFGDTQFGISSRPTTWGSDTNYNLTVLQQVIDYMDTYDLGLYRMCFATDANFATIKTFVEYYLDNSQADLIINYYHQYPPRRNGQLGRYDSKGIMALWKLQHIF